MDELITRLEQERDAAESELDDALGALAEAQNRVDRARRACNLANQTVIRAELFRDMEK